jgi:hypothetical protein
MVVLGLFAGAVDTQAIDVRKPPLWRGIPLGLERPVDFASLVNSRTVTVFTIGELGSSYFFERTDVRGSNTWVTADNILYSYTTVEIVDLTVRITGRPDDAFYSEQVDVMISRQEREIVQFPNKTYLTSVTTTSGTNDVEGGTTYQASRHLYGIERGLPLTKTQFQRIKTWLGM